MYMRTHPSTFYFFYHVYTHNNPAIISMLILYSILPPAPPSRYPAAVVHVCRSQAPDVPSDGIRVPQARRHAKQH